MCALWTRRFADQIKYDMNLNPADDQSGVVTLEDLISNQLETENLSKYQSIDLTKEFQETLNMYINLYGHKVLDLNEDSHFFSDLNNILMSSGKSNLGTMLLNKLAQLRGGISQKYRLCIVSRIHGGERLLTEVKFDTETGKLKVDEGKQPRDTNKFKKFFSRNINVLNLHSRIKAIGKKEFMEGAKMMPFVFDLMRAESLWQDRKFELQVNAFQMSN